MGIFNNIVVFHPAAIGDATLASPVSLVLKANYPQARLLYITHSLLIPLLKLANVVDEFVPYERHIGLARAQIKLLQPDLLVDLSGSTKSFLQTAGLSQKILRYRKQSTRAKSIQHAADNFLDTISPLALPLRTPLFPSLYPACEDERAVRQILSYRGNNLIALVPGVGNKRSHRAWKETGWVNLVRRILANTCYLPVLVGGKDDAHLCERIYEETDKACLNVCGKLSLVQTAALLKLASATVSGDTGPAHISVAVGTSVIGLYGPTYPARSGPYKMDDLVLDATKKCVCHAYKQCLLSGKMNAGTCLESISVEAVFDRLLYALEKQAAAN